MAIEIVDFPINSMVIFHSYVNVYQRVSDFLDDGPHFLMSQSIRYQSYRTTMNSDIHGFLDVFPHLQE
jgi:hypothetical protein